MSCSAIGGFGFADIKVRKSSLDAKVNMFGDFGAVASAALITKPCTLIGMSSSVSINSWFITSMALCRVDVSMFDAPIHTVSPDPIAITDVCNPEIRGAGLVVYPASWNIAANSWSSVAGGVGDVL